MATSPAHRSTRSMSSPNNLQNSSPSPRARRLTSPSQAGLNVPEGGLPQHFSRPPSPLRNGFIPDTSTGIDPEDDSDEDEDDDDDHERWVDRSPSPSSSVSQLAASFAQRVGSFVDGIKLKSPHMPTDAELEAEAQRERDRSRREAEAILTREAEQRRLVEERVLSMLESTKSLPPPPSHTPNMSNPTSPASSQKEKEKGWWSAAKNRLTPTKDKESLTPAQQVIHDAKAREKDQKKSGKGKEKASDWSANPQGKYTDSVLGNLNIPPVSPQRRPVPGSPASPTPSRPSLSNMAPNLTPSPMRSVDNLSTSPSREAPPLYAQFNVQGALDVPGTLLVIAKRFEKLEKWTVGHVRALEERMNDVEHWLVDKEAKEKEEKGSTASNINASQELNEIREEIGELQGRVGELGREMAKMVISPANLLSGPSRQSPMINSVSPTNSLIATPHSPSGSASNTPQHSRLVSVTARESTSPPMASSSKNSGTRLPYPTGDYASPPNAFSPPSSPPTAKTRPISISNSTLSNTQNLSASFSNSPSLSTPSISNLRTVSPTSTSSLRAISPSASITSLSKSSSPNLPTPKIDNKRQSSVSPTPRKRYTVALGEPIRSQSPVEEETTPLAHSKRNGGTPISFHKPQTSIGTAMFSTSPLPGLVGISGGSNGGADSASEDDGFQDETIGKSSSARLVSKVDNHHHSHSITSTSDKSDIFSSTNAKSNVDNRPARRPRPQSTYTFGSSANFTFPPSSQQQQPQQPPPQASVQPLRPRLRSKSTDRFGSTDSLSSVSSVSSTNSSTGKFVDPLALRKQERDQNKIPRLANPKGKGKVAVGQLVAFFDGDK